MKQIKSKVSQIIMLIMVQVFFFACERDEPDFSPPASDRRTVLVYLGTDNNFRAEAAQKTEQLKSGWDATFDGNLLVYADTGDRPVLIHIYSHPQRGSIADTVETYPPGNSASPATLTRVLNRVREYRPAASYGLVVLSHATGWLPAGMSEPAPVLKSVILDKGAGETDSYMELADFAAAIPCRLDFMIFDACFMGSVEVACELKDKTDYLVASPAEVLSPGFVYSTMMRHLFRPEADLAAVAKDFYDYGNRQSGLHRSATVSVVRTSELEQLKRFCHSAPDAASPGQTDLAGVQTFGYGSQKIYFDLGDYVQKRSPERYGEFQSALDNCIVYKACTDGYYSAGTGTLQVIRAFSGLSVYVPQPQYPHANAAYKKLKWAQETGDVPYYGSLR
ncbi:MAG: hypothetical protein LBK22_04615 [Tannerella sp.]|jgi:hypothetical protein|nr:hypothetical protein [Tannerella sp.]